MPFLTLRQLLRLLLGVAAPAEEATPPPAAPVETVDVRIVAANISSGNLQSYPDPGPGVRILDALDPDVVLIQELNVNATRNAPDDEAAVRAWVDRVFGTDYAFFREPGNDSIPNGIVSRFPILEAGEWRDAAAPDRDFAFARIDLPGPTDLWAVSVHLLTNDGRRPGQTESLTSEIETRVPEEAYLVVGGDLNTDRRNEPAIGILGRVVDTLGPFPDDGADPPRGGTNASRSKPYDWVLADAELEALAIPTEIGGLVFPNGLVFDSRVFSADELDEHFPPVQPGDSGAPAMQHMAVVRDFRIGGGDGGGPPESPGEDPGETGLETPPGGDPPGHIPPPAPDGSLDLAGFRLEQTGGDAALTFSAGTVLAPGGLLVVGRDASREEFELFWGPLDAAVVYLDGAALAGAPGFPVINGGERYRLLDPDGRPVDPASGTLPATALARRESRERAATDAADFARRDQLGATPGRYGGAVAATGAVVITEISDARQFEFEFVELLYDAAAPADPDP